MIKMLDLSSEKLDIIILAGQSNAFGFGRGEDKRPYQKDERILKICDKQGIDFVKDKDNGYDYLKVKYPSEFFVDVAEEIKSDDGKLGNFALHFAKEYIADGKLKNGRKLLIVFSPVGGTGFSKHHWGKGEVLYQRMIDMIDKALGFNKENRIVAFLWHQGEHDVVENAELTTRTRKAFYIEKFRTFIRSIIEKYDLQGTPILCGGFTDEFTGEFKEGAKAVIEGLKRVCKEIGNASYVSAKGLKTNNQQIGNGDIYHFSRISLKKFGKRYYKAYKGLLKK